jgi:hypothetical protein
VIQTGVVNCETLRDENSTGDAIRQTAMGGSPSTHQLGWLGRRWYIDLLSAWVLTSCDEVRQRCRFRGHVSQLGALRTRTKSRAAVNPHWGVPACKNVREGGWPCGQPAVNGVCVAVMSRDVKLRGRLPVSTVWQHFGHSKATAQTEVHRFCFRMASITIGFGGLSFCCCIRWSCDLLCKPYRLCRVSGQLKSTVRHPGQA